MTYTEAREILTAHNRWLRDNDCLQPMRDPKKIGEAIDVACSQLCRLEVMDDFYFELRKCSYVAGRSRRLARHKARAQAGRRWDTRGTPGATYETPIRTIGVIHWSGMWASSTLLVRRPSRQKVRAR